MNSEQVFKLLSNKARLRILALLAKSPMRVGELTEITGMAMVTISKELMLLRAKKIVSAKRQGIFITYFFNKTDEANLLKKLLEETKAFSPKEIFDDENAFLKFKRAPLPQTKFATENFTGNKISPKKERGNLKTSPQNAHIGELPTNLL